MTGRSERGGCDRGSERGGVTGRSERGGCDRGECYKYRRVSVT